MVLVGPGVEVHGWVDDVLDAVEEQRAVGADVEQPLHAEDLRAARLQEHRQPDPERRPVERLVEDDGDRPDFAVAMRARLVRGTSSRGSLPTASKRSIRRRHRRSAPRRCRAAGFRPCEPPCSADAGSEIGLRDDERVGGGGLLQRLGPRSSPCCRVDGRDDALQLVVVLDDGLGEQRVDDRAPGRRARSSRRRLA